MSGQFFGNPDLTITPRNQTETMGLNGTLAKEILDPLGKDEQYDLGWKSHFDTIPKGKVVVVSSTSGTRVISPGNVIHLSLNMTRISPIAYDVAKKYESRRILEVVKLLENFSVPFEVAEVVASESSSRYPNVYAEMDNLWEHLVENFPPMVLSIIRKELFLEAKLNEYATQLACTYQVPKNKTYLQADTNAIYNQLNSWSMNVMYALCFSDLDAVLSPLVTKSSSQDSMSLISAGMLIVMVMVITVLIIYSQIQRSVEGRAYELGMMRVHGMGRCGVAMLVVIQGLMFAVPGVVFGVAGAQGINVGVMALFKKMADLTISWKLSPWSVIVTVLVVIGATLVASFFPIRTALSMNLHDSIDVQHTNASAVLVTIERSDSVNSSLTLLVDGVILTVFGGAIYVLFPYSLVSGNNLVMMVILVVLVICIMVALVLLCMNFEYVFELIVSTVLLFWEKSAVRTMAQRNMSKHRLRNRGTTLMFALILCFVFFMDVLSNTVIESMRASEYQMFGCDLNLKAVSQIPALMYQKYENWNGSVFFPPPLFTANVSSMGFRIQDAEELISVLNEYSDVVEAVGYTSCPLSEQQGGRDATVMLTNRGRSHQSSYDLVALPPNFKAATFESTWRVGESLNDRKEMTGDDVIKQMYASYFDAPIGVVSRDFQKQQGAGLGDRFVLKKNLSTNAAYYQHFYSNTLFNEEESEAGGKENEVTKTGSDVVSVSSIFQNITIGAVAKYVPAVSVEIGTMSPQRQLPVSFPVMSEAISSINGAFSSPAFDDMCISDIKVKYKKGASSSRIDSLENIFLSRNKTNVTSSLSSSFLSAAVNGFTADPIEFIDSHGNSDANDTIMFHSDFESFMLNEKKERNGVASLFDVFRSSWLGKLFGIESSLSYDEASAIAEFSTGEGNNPNLHVDVWSKKKFDKTLNLIITLMQVSFSLLAVLISFLGECSLVAAMTSNVLSSIRDYGMMRSMGLSKFQVRRVYIEEAFILVMTAAVMGVISGMILSYMLSSQMMKMLFLDVTSFYFPYITLIAFVLISVLLGYMSTSTPLAYLGQLQIADCMRSL
ncbi:putative efflux ABC transporter, permease domain containing protein [Monocercomonoides exilis]|uniref:putative efflux ABC transporter, permease domain containing protein n=1 Tax=Monocercomonoides exilis TaxID=2049356 RepID=UPI003559FBE8|nr:putative efflux ABC transporter, permease domain containing protein [Monocercomonoides exilis]|eukprot:MONOS_7269.1-p1 / transcript=MONOS_7269.1 / gene=MONOS_7269 / organism=Monocercomonoides_exilis_PA203 / gene_product=efflux ABC transporter, permease domain containing protein / transcript_product=efflux ABC transporter, permease domain containing protein / location=Mono_scaffold00244:49828-53842(-) / protein_length=1061 / sequence_SO=supercontig / SO=protein_coding / is_pseudo=false